MNAQWCFRRVPDTTPTADVRLLYGPNVPVVFRIFLNRVDMRENSLKDMLRSCAVSLLLLHSGLTWAGDAAKIGIEPTPARQAELMNLVRQDCGSCHGLRLEGGLGLPLTPQALKEKPPETLKEVILHGRNGTPMPPWSPFLTDAEADWIVRMLLKGLP